MLSGSRAGSASSTNSASSRSAFARLSAAVTAFFGVVIVRPHPPRSPRRAGGRAAGADPPCFACAEMPVPIGQEIPGRATAAASVSLSPSVYAKWDGVQPELPYHLDVEVEGEESCRNAYSRLPSP